MAWRHRAAAIDSPIWEATFAQEGRSSQEKKEDLRRHGHAGCLLCLLPPGAQKRKRKGFTRPVRCFASAHESLRMRQIVACSLSHHFRLPDGASLFPRELLRAFRCQCRYRRRSHVRSRRAAALCAISAAAAIYALITGDESHDMPFRVPRRRAEAAVSRLLYARPMIRR